MPVDRFLHPRAGKSHKVTMLTDLEYRVWTQYILSADDFGVMRATALAIQNDNDHLANRPAKVIQRCLDALVTAGLLHAFTHQGKPYVWQHDWQTWQKVEYPRATLQPCPPADSLPTGDDLTRQLFGLHPGGNGRKFRRGSGNIPEAPSESSRNTSEISATNAGARTREVANGKRLVANGFLEGGVGETESFATDEAFVRFSEAYPGQGRCASHLALTAFVDVLGRTTFGELLTRLEGHKRSHQWRVKGMIPRLDKYLRDGLYLQELPEHPVSTLVNDKTVRTMTSAAEFARGEHGTR